MGTKLNKVAYKELIVEDMENVEKYFPEHSLEKKHIQEVLKCSIECYYPSEGKKQTDTGSNCNLQNVVTLNWEGIDADIKFILGRPNFICGSIARRLRELGHECNKKSEDEQALVIYTMLSYCEKHGKDWKDELNKYLKGA